MNLENLFSVAGKVVCVTGGGGGIGSMIATGFVAGGARVYIASRSDLGERAAHIDASGPGSCTALQADVSRDDDIAALATTLEQHEGRLDVLVNNAGLSRLARFDEFPMTTWDEVVGVNLRAPFALTQQCLDLLETAGRDGAHASVINIGSVDGIRIPSDDDWAYGMGKAGIHQLTRQMAGRLGNRGGRRGGRNITFNAVAPGPFPGMLDVPLSDPDTRDAIASATSVGRIGEPEDMAGVCIWLASRAGAYVTGAVIPVDGGLLVSRGANG